MHRPFPFLRFAAVATASPIVALLAASCGGDTLDVSDLDAGAGSDATLRDTGLASSDGANQADGSEDGSTEGDAAIGGDDDAGSDGALADAEAPDGDAAARRDADSGDADAGDGGDLLKSATPFAVLAGSTITITPSLLTTIGGDVGVSPGTSIMTLPPGQPTGTAYAGGPVALQAQLDLTTAYNALAARPCLPANNKAGVDLGGKKLPPAVYCFPSTSAQITGALQLDAQLDPNAVWVFQIGTTLTTATSASVTVINGGSACNVYWLVGTSATLGTTTAFAGNILALTSITMVNGASILVGRALAQNGAVSLDANQISTSACQ